MGALGAAQAVQPRGHLGGPVVVEAHPVDDGAVVDEPEQPRTRVARLGARRDGADLDVAKAQRAEPGDRVAVFVEAGGNTEWCGKREAKCVNGCVSASARDGPRDAGDRAHTEHTNDAVRERVCAFWVESGQDMTKQQVVHAHLRRPTLQSRPVPSDVQRAAA